MSTTIIPKEKEVDQKVNQVSNSIPFKLIFKLALTSSTLILFISTGVVQFTCYPMVTVGNLPKSCKAKAIEIVQNKKTHGNVLVNFASDPDLDEEELRVLVTSLDRPHVSSNPRDIQAQLALNPKTPADVLEKLTKSEDPIILSQIASRKNATDNVFRAVVKNPSFDNLKVRTALASNSNTPTDVLRKVASTSNEIDIQRELAFHAKTPEDVLQNLAKIQNYGILQAVINNKNTSIKVLDEVGNNPLTWQSKFSYIQVLLASQDNISERLAKKIAKSNNEDALHHLLDNPSSSISPELRNSITNRLSNPAEKLIASKPPVEINTISKPKCEQKHNRNNLIGMFSGGAGIAALLAFGNPIALPVELPFLVGYGAYSLITGGLELFTRC